MQDILKSKIFTQYNFSKIDYDYTLEGLIDEKIDYFNLEKVCLQILFYKKYVHNLIPDKIDKFIIQKNDIKYINLEGIIELSKHRNDYRMCILHIDLGLSKIENVQGLELVYSESVKYSEQSKFTFTIYKFLKKYHPNIKLLVEEYLIETGKSYRCDLLLPDENVRIIIEHYESFHKNNKYYDGIRQETFEGLGYSFLKFNEGESIRKFINTLDELIKDRMLFLDITKNEDLIIKTLIDGGCDKMIATNMYQLYKIGDNFEIKFSDIMLSLGYSSDELDDAIQELKLKISNDYYIQKDDDYYLNSTGYKLLLLRSTNPMVYPYQEYYVKLEKVCYDTILRSRNQAKKMYDNMQNAAPQLIKYGRDQADKILIKNLEKSINRTNEQKKLIKYYEQERKKMFKIKISEEEKKFDKKLEEGDIIVPYIPSLVFTNDINEEVEINQIKSLHKVFKDSFNSNDKISFKIVIEIIKKRLNIENISSYEKIIPNCKIIG
jgi:hypothetical protein